MRRWKRGIIASGQFPSRCLFYLCVFLRTFPARRMFHPDSFAKYSTFSFQTSPVFSQTGQGNPRRISVAVRSNCHPASCPHREHLKCPPCAVRQPGIKPGASPWSTACIRTTRGLRGTGPNKSDRVIRAAPPTCAVYAPPFLKCRSQTESRGLLSRRGRGGARREVPSLFLRPFRLSSRPVRAEGD